MWPGPSVFCGGDQSKIGSWLFRRCIEPWGAIGITIKALRYKNPYSSRKSAGREENFVFFWVYTVTRDYPQKLVALKIIAAAGKDPIAVSLYRCIAVLLVRCIIVSSAALAFG